MIKIQVVSPLVRGVAPFEPKWGIDVKGECEHSRVHTKDIITPTDNSMA